MYTINRFDGRVTAIVKRTTDGTQYIPVSTDNPAYQEFLAWNATQNPPLNLDSEPPPPRRRPRQLSAIMDTIAALSNTDKQRLFAAVAAVILQQNADIARRIGLAFDGDEEV